MQDFDKIYAEYFSEVYKFVLSLCQNPEMAEEITQEAFFKALKNIDSSKVIVNSVPGCVKLQKILFIAMQRSITDKLTTRLI